MTTLKEACLNIATGAQENPTLAFRLGSVLFLQGAIGLVTWEGFSSQDRIVAIGALALSTLCTSGRVGIEFNERGQKIRQEQIRQEQLTFE